MYKLKLKAGKIATVKMNGFTYYIQGGWSYSQERLKELYDAGHRNLVSKVKVKDGKEREHSSDKDI